MKNPKILTPASLIATVKKLRRAGKKIVFTNGTFDILHAGHVTYLQKAKTFGDVLIVGVNSDHSVKVYKSPDRPINPQDERILLITALSCVDYAIIFDDPTPIHLILKIKPNVLVKGADWKKSDIAGAREVESWGGSVKLVNMVEGRSSTRIIKLLGLGA